MKRIFVLAAAACLGACAAQAPKAVTPEQAAAQANATALPATAQPAQPTDRVYLDDRDLIHMQAPPLNRRVLILGSGKEAN